MMWLTGRIYHNSLSGPRKLLRPCQGFTPPAESHARKVVDEWLSGRDSTQTSRSEADNKKLGATSVRAWGSTLIELILVLAVMMALTAFLVPNFSSVYKSASLKSSVDELADVMRYAQSRAVTHNKMVELQFDQINGTYWLKEAEQGADAATLKPLSGRMGRMYALSRGEIKAQEEQLSIRFLPDGTISKNRVVICADDCYTVSTQEVRGTVEVIKGELL